LECGGLTPLWPAERYILCKGKNENDQSGVKPPHSKELSAKQSRLGRNCQS